jgi:ABC-type oligopeptide transport system ATPase subunit
VQAQVLNLLADLRAELGLTMLFISHDLAAVRSLCDRVVVLYLGRVMEEGQSRAVFSAPQHPYTMALLSAMPSLDLARRRARILLQGEREKHTGSRSSSREPHPYLYTGSNSQHRPVSSSLNYYR